MIYIYIYIREYRQVNWIVCLVGYGDCYDIAPMGAQVHTKKHTQRHKAKLERPPHGKDAKLLASVASGDNVTSRKRVFRPILTSPFAASWPRISKVDGDVILHTLLEILCDKDTQGLRPRQHISSHFVVGVNSVTRSLETRIHASRQEIQSRMSTPPLAAPPRYLFVCTGDMDPPVLVAHLPTLVASYNAMCAGPRSEVKDDSIGPNLSWAPAESHLTVPSLVLVVLPEGAEFMLSTALQIRRLSALMVDSQLDPEQLHRLDLCVQQALGPETMIRGYRLAWLDRQGIPALDPPHVKHIASSAPTLLKGRVKKVRKPDTAN